MKDILKWVPIMLIAAILYYLVAPKYQFLQQSTAVIRCNKTTGTVEWTALDGRPWRSLPAKKTSADKKLN